MLSSVAAAISLVFLAGCETTPKDERSEGRALDDKNITESVKKSLDSEPAYKFNGVNVDTFAGIVQLTGFVNTDVQKVRAGEIAQGCNGVKMVVNGISLKPIMPTATSRTNTDQRIYADPQTPTFESGQSKGSTPSGTEPK
jgi:hypothetical protein